jgi:hypothetical protein
MLAGTFLYLCTVDIQFWKFKEKKQKITNDIISFSFSFSFNLCNIL